MPLFGPPNIEKMKAKKDVNGLLKLLSKSKDLEQTKKAIAALGEIGDPVVVPRLIGTLQYEYFSMDMLDMGTDAYFKIKTANNELRSAAAYALGSIGDVRAVPALRKITESSVSGFFFDGSDSLARAAESALRMIGSKHAPKPTLQTTPTPQPQPKPQAAAPRQTTTKKPSLPARLPGPIPAHTYLHDGNLMEGPGNGAAEFQSALEHWNHQRYSDALDHYKKALAAGLTSVYEAAAHSNMGKIYLMQDNVAAAVDHFIKALWLNPITASVAYGCATHLALIYEQLGMAEDTRTAVEEAQQALKLINTIMSAEAAQKVKDTVKRVYPQGTAPSIPPGGSKTAAQSISTETPRGQINHLIQVLTASDPSEQRAAARQLEALGGDAVEPLIEALKNGSKETQIAAVTLLGKIGDVRAIPPLLEAVFKGGDTYGPARKALRAIGEPARPAIFAAYEEKVNTNQPGTRLALYYGDDLIGDLGGPRAVELLEKAFHAQTPHMRGGIIKNLARIGGDQAIAVLVQALRPEDTRAAAGRHLEKLKDASVPALQAALDSDNPELRSQAARILQKIGMMTPEQAKAIRASSSKLKLAPSPNPASTPRREPPQNPADELNQAMHDLDSEDAALRRSAALRLKKIGAPAVEPLIQRLNHKNMVVRKSAAGILGKIGDPRAIQSLLEISLSYEDKQLRAVCDTALLSIGEPIYETVVQQLTLRLHDWNGITTSADLLGRLGDPRAAGPLEEVWQAHVADSYIVKALGMLEGDAGCPALVRFLANEQSRSAAANWLLKKGDAALPALQEGLNAEDEEVRKQAAKVLKKLGAPVPEQSKPTSLPKQKPQPEPKPAATPCHYPQWEQVKKDPHALPPRMLSELQKAMVFIVCENGEEQAVAIVRADRGEFQTTITTATPMRLCVDFYTGRNGDVFGIYPLVLDNASDPAFKETWLSPYDDRPEFQTGDPLSAEQRKRLHLLLNQRAVWMIFIDHRDQYLWVRRVEYTPQQIQKFKEYAHKLNGYRGRTTEKTQYFALLQEYMAAVPLETLRRQFVQLFRE